jgi:cytidylate kinase
LNDIVYAHSPIITIDGPTASGKGTVARAVAKALGFHLLDSGAIYRAIALLAIRKNIKSNEINILQDESKVISLEFHDKLILLDGADATDEIRSEAVGMMASTLSAIPEIRAAVLERQRAFAQAPGLVADGRDMGTVVFPDALLKIYLTATAQTRAQRRSGQLAKRQLRASGSTSEGAAPEVATATEQGANVQNALESVIAKIRQRDAQDKQRVIAPLRPALDAIVIDNAEHEPQQTIDAVLTLWALRKP